MQRIRNEKRLIALKVARMYYTQGLTQESIAQTLKISRSTVSRLLKWAKNQGLVKIIVFPVVDVDLTKKLAKKYDCDFVIVEVFENNAEHIREELGKAAAQYLLSILDDGMNIGVSWGQTLAQLAKALSVFNGTFNKVNVVQLVGGLGAAEVDTHSINVTAKIAANLGGIPHFLPAPGIVESATLKDQLLNNPQIRQTVDLFERLDIAIVGIGALHPDSTLIKYGNILKNEDIEDLRVAGAVGDVALRFFNAQGKPVQTKHDPCVLGIDLKTLLRVPKRIGIAGGLEKITAIRGALSGKLVNVLITDNFVARALLEMEGENHES